MSARPTVEGMVPVAAPAKLVSYEDRLKASFQSLPKPADTAVGPFGPEEAGWPALTAAQNAENFLTAYTQAVEGTNLHLATQRVYVRDMRQMYHWTGFYAMLSMDEQGQTDWVRAYVTARMNLPPGFPMSLSIQDENKLRKWVINYMAVVRMVAVLNVPF